MFFLIAGLLGHRLDVAIHEIIRPIGLLASHGWTREDQIIGHWIRTVTTPPLQVLGHVLVHGDGSGRRFGFAISDDLMPDRTGYIELQKGEVYVQLPRRQWQVGFERGSSLQEQGGPRHRHWHLVPQLPR